MFYRSSQPLSEKGENFRVAHVFSEEKCAGAGAVRKERSMLILLICVVALFYFLLKQKWRQYLDYFPPLRQILMHSHIYTQTPLPYDCIYNILHRADISKI